MLIGHWKLDGNANDSSGNNQHATTVSGVTYSNGKINQCGDFSSSTTDYIKISLNKALGQTFSIAGWFLKRAHTVTSYPIFLSFGLPYIACSGSTSSFRVSYNRESDSAQVNLSGTTIPILDAWYHVAIISGTETLKIYINGIEENSTTVLSHYDFSTQFDLGRLLNNNTYSIDGQVDDVRIYDHILSQKEIHELSLAQVLHYDFNMFSEPTTNLADNGNFENGLNGWTTGSGIITNAYTNYYGVNYAIHMTRPITISGYVGIKYDPNISVTASTAYTQSIRFYLPKQLDKTIRFYTPEYNSGDGLINYRHYLSITSSTTINQWITLTHTFTTDATASYFSAVSFDWHTTASTTQDDEIIIDYIQLEKKDHATPGINNSRTGQVLDNSGNDNHSTTLTESLTPEHITDSHLGSGAYSFDGTTKISVGRWVDDLIGSSNKITMMAWIDRTSSLDLYNVFMGSYLPYLSFMSDNTMLFAVNLDGVSKDVQTATTYSNSTWYHVAGTYDGAILKIYVDAILKDSLNIVGTLEFDGSATNVLGIGDSIGSGSLAYPFNGYIDDVRIYSEALTIEDIEEIVSTRASIDDEGILWAK